ncbi:hypothetical protein IU450_05340 [Nocardia abscessus]|uniref:hypothetical protein n=1 Tax=Nocardia abscessus TaxID=120957 RepID=UPI00189570CF|nr:hypothetical protein [Nocardia abscessus]MBF6335303.1 hypothetical protein [Nocardia abscessus]
MIACDGLCTRPLDTTALRVLLRECSGVRESEIFVSSDDLVDAALREDPRDSPFAVFCTHGQVGGDFAATFSVSADLPLPEQNAMDGREFAGLLAAHTAADILCGFGDEPQPWLWTLTRPDGTRAIVHLTEHFNGSDYDSACPCRYLHRNVIYPNR